MCFLVLNLNISSISSSERPFKSVLNTSVKILFSYLYQVDQNWECNLMNKDYE
jgi:hypothetical protein